MARTFENYIQLDQMDCGPTCLRMIAKHYGKYYTAQTLREKAQISRNGVSLLGIAEAAEAIGFHSVGVKTTTDKLLEDLPLPCILHWGQNHFVVLYAIENTPFMVSRLALSRLWGGRNLNSEISLEQCPLPDSTKSQVNASVKSKRFRISDPARGLINFTTDEFEKKWLSDNKDGQKLGLALLLEPTTRFYEEEGEKAAKVNFWQLSGYLGRFKSLVFQLGLGILISSGLSIILPFLTQSVVDVGISTQNLSFIQLVLIGQLVLVGSIASVDFLRSWILLHISTRVNLSILSEFISKLMRLPVSFFDVKQFGDIMQRIGDHQRIEAFLTGQMLNTIFSLFSMVAFGFILAYYQLQIFLLTIGASALYAGWVIIFLKQRRKIDNKKFGSLAQNQGQIVQLIQGMQDIKLSGSETPKRWEWERTQADLFKWNIKSLSLSQYQQAGALLINQSKNVLITFLAAKAVLDGQLTLGGMMSIQYILGQFNGPIEQLIGFLQSWQDAQISLERLNEVHSLQDEELVNGNKRKDWNPEQDIKINNLMYTYPGAGNLSVLKGINLTIEHGKTTAIVGTSGSGKTTLLKLLLRFYPPQSGSISLKVKREELLAEVNNLSRIRSQSRLAGELDLDFISHRAWRQQCGVVMQDGFIFSDTIARNISVASDRIDQDRLYHAAYVANIHEFIESLPLGYYTKIGAEGNGISQGQKQRILIARAVYKNPQILLFDEATNALDAKNESIIVRNLEEFFRGRTVIVVAHRLSTVKNANQIVVMEKGEIVEQGTHSELVIKKGKYFELISNQLELND